MKLEMIGDQWAETLRRKAEGYAREVFDVGLLDFDAAQIDETQRSSDGTDARRDRDTARLIPVSERRKIDNWDIRLDVHEDPAIGLRTWRSHAVPSRNAGQMSTTRVTRRPFYPTRRIARRATSGMY